MDMILLYIDNEPHALAHVLNEVRECQLYGVKCAYGHLEYFIKAKVPGIMRRHKDQTSADCLSEELGELKHEGCDNALYWKGVYKHYLTKHEEGERLENYLT